LLGAAGWALYSVSDNGGSSSQKENAGDSGAASASEILAKAPNFAEIAAAMPVQPREEPRKPDPPAPKPPPVVQAATNPAPTVVEPGMTETEIAARKAAWASLLPAARSQPDTPHGGPEGGSDLGYHANPSKLHHGDGRAARSLHAGRHAAQPPASKDFFAGGSNPATDYLPFTTTDPLSQYEIKAGDVITGTMISGLKSDARGEIIATVSRAVTDYATHEHILIPQGSRLVGTYDNAVGYGQTLVVTGWDRIIYPGPCAQSLDLGRMPGSDQSGYAGFSDITENHLGKIFLNGLLISAFSAGIQLSQPQQSAFSGYSSQSVVGGAIGQQLGQIGMEFARRGMDIPPTQKIRNGYAFTILVTKDIAFDHPWVDGECKKFRVAAR
jgi:type IV secretory pathway VirB10-like protein